MGEWIKVKLSKRYGLRLLKSGDCKVKLDDDFNPEWEDKVFTTRCADYMDDDIIYIYELNEYVDIQNIKSIYHQATRFSDLMIFEEVNWND